MKPKPWMAVTCVIALCSVLPAQTSQKSKNKPSTMNIPQPAPEMKKLAKLWVGTWRVDEKILPSPMAPNGGSGKGSETMRIGPGSTSILMDYKGSAMGNFTGHGIVSWSPEKQVYQSVWVDSMLPGGIMTLEGKWEGENLVFSGTENMEGKRMVSRHTYSDLKPDSFIFTMEMGPEGGRLEKMMVLEYKRTAGGAARAKTPEPASTKQ